MFEGFSKFKADLTSTCIECGSCFANCYAFRTTNFPIFKHLKELFKHNSTKITNERIKSFLRNCIYCKRCQINCVKGLDLTLRIPAIKYELSKIYDNYTWLPLNSPTALGNFINARRYSFFIKNLTNELISKDFRTEFEKYRQPEKRDVVFFSGCGIQALENQYYILLDIFKKLNLNFGLLEGLYQKNICCGAVFFDLGRFIEGLFFLKNLLTEIKKFETKKVIVYCATCFYGLKKIAPQLIENYDLEIMHASGYLADVLKNPELKNLLKSPEKKQQIVTIHDSCHLAHSGDVTSIRNLLNTLPYVEIAEMKHSKQNSICDASCVITQSNNPLKMLYKKDILPIIDEAVDVNADVLCSLCPGCHAVLSILGDGIISTIQSKRKRIPVKNWVTILGEFLGLQRRDMLSYRFSHIISIPFKDSGLFYIWKALKAFVRGYIGMKEPAR